MEINLAMAGQCFVKMSVATLHENPSVGSGVCKYAQTVGLSDKWRDRRNFESCFSRPLDGTRRHIFKYIFLQNKE
jgi:hypothetical protein